MPKAIPLPGKLHWVDPGNDILQDIYPTADGNYILIGIDSLKGGDVEYQPYGRHDIWIIKMDPFQEISSGKKATVERC